MKKRMFRKLKSERNTIKEPEVVIELPKEEKPKKKTTTRKRTTKKTTKKGDK